MLYNGRPVQVPACENLGKHHPDSSMLCTFDAFMERVKEMSITDEEYKSICKSDKEIIPDWD